MKFNTQYYSSYYEMNFLRKVGNKFFSPKVPALFNIIQGLPPKSKVIDIGSGTGGFLRLIEKANSGLDTFGLDIGFPPELLCNGSFLRGNAMSLPFQDNSFNLVICSHVIEHLKDPFPVIDELKRICAKRGYVYVETPSHRSVLMPIGNNFWDDPTHVRPYSRVSLRKMFEISEIKTIKDGVKRSLAGILLGFPYMFVGRILGDPLARTIFPIYTFGLSVYILGRKDE